jgi:chromatin remodeling complex protein RSC6
LGKTEFSDQFSRGKLISHWEIVNNSLISIGDCIGKLLLLSIQKLKIMAKKATPKKKAAPKKAAKKAAKKKSARKPNAAFMAPLTPSSTLADVIGSQARPRTEIVKKIWDYIKKNNLQDKKNRRMINADAKLKTLFGGKGQVSMFDLAKIVSKHVK